MVNPFIFTLLSFQVKPLGRRFLALRKRNEFHFDAQDSKVINAILMEARRKHAAVAREKAEAAAYKLRRAHIALPTLRPNYAVTSVRPQWSRSQGSITWAKMAATRA